MACLWTDRCPLPVLSIVLLQMLGALSMLCMLPVYGRVFPFFWMMIKGLATTQGGQDVAC